MNHPSPDLSDPVLPPSPKQRHDDPACRPPVIAPVPLPVDRDALATGLAALAHPARLEIVGHLAAADACCCGELVRRVGRAQSTVSQHLKILVEAGLVSYSPDRQRSRYMLDRAALARLSEAFAALAEACSGEGARR